MSPSSAAARHRTPPRSHWLLLVLGMLWLVVALTVAGYTGGSVGESAHAPQPRPVAGRVPTSLLQGGPVIDPASTAAGLRVPARHVVLTFDDGPTRWTPQVLDELERAHVPATFFVTGTNVAEHPELVRRMYRDGHEVGVHTFSHVNLADVAPWRARLEIDQTQLAIAALTGHTTDLLRPPYSSTPRGMTAADWKAYRSVGPYRLVLADRDTRDWSRPGVAAIVRAALPAHHAGAVVMLHDGGGNRAETVAALRQIITGLKARGYHFDTVTSATRLPTAWHPATVVQRARGWVSLGLVTTSRFVASLLTPLFTVVAVLAVLRTMLLLLFARRHAHAVRRPGPGPAAPLPGVSVVVPAYNEEKGIVAAVRSLVASDYPELEVLVVDDGSTDRTADVVEALGLARVTVVRQPNGGKPSALNTGIARARHDLLVLVDGDTVFEPDALRALVAPFADPEVGAVSGNTKVGNRRGLLGRWQHIEYVIGFNLDRRLFDLLRCMPTVPGAIGAFRRSTLEQVGGLSSDTLAEDTDLTMAVLRAGWRVVYAPDARAWTEAPSTLAQLARQRYRWCFGTLQAMWKHRRAVIERGQAGHLGRRGLPYLLLFQVLLPMLAPAIDVAALYAVLFTPTATIAFVWLGFLAMQYLSAAYAFRLDRESYGPLWSLVLQQVVYRQLMYLVVIQSVASAGYGSRLRWHSVPRTGRLESAPPA